MVLEATADPNGVGCVEVRALTLSTGEHVLFLSAATWGQKKKNNTEIYHAKYFAPFFLFDPGAQAYSR